LSSFVIYLDPIEMIRFSFFYTDLDDLIYVYAEIMSMMIKTDNLH
jgi:hypothetical protein